MHVFIIVICGGFLLGHLVFSRGSALALEQLVGAKTALSSTSLRCCGNIYNSDEALDAGPLQGQLKAANKSN